MTLVALIRHAPTAWNAENRVQGRTDIPLSSAGRNAAAAWRIPVCLAGFEWISSPLGRCRETARLLRGGDVPTDPRLAEMDWGDWSGELRQDLRDRLGAAFAENEARGLDFQPPGGESPRMVQQRVLPVFAERAERGTPTVAVTHRGVIRAVLGLATGWDFLGKPPVRLAWDCAHLFRIGGRGRPAVERLNVPLAAGAGAG